MIEEPGWDLLLLDMTLDLRRGGVRRPSSAQDYTGGLKIIGQMYWDELLAPTIIITAFDSFPSQRRAKTGMWPSSASRQSKARRARSSAIS